MLVRRRYYFWLFKAYIKRWRKTIVASIIIGVTFFFGIILLANYYLVPIFSNKYEKIGYAGTFTMSSLPDQILKDISYGLTSVDANSSVNKGIAKNWKISSNGKVYTFDLKDDLRLSGGGKFTINEIPYSFKDVKKKIIDENTIEFTLKDPYAPFLSVVAKPIIIKNAGFNVYKIGKVEENAGFIKSLTLINSKNDTRKIIYFYPTHEALKTAFQLGEVKTAKNLPYDSHAQNYFKNWYNVKSEKNTDFTNLVTLFFNTSDKSLSNKKIRQALSYALPKEFNEGERTFSFIPKKSIYYTQSPNEGILDLELAKSLLQSSDARGLNISIQTADKNLQIAKKISEAWKKIGVKTEIKTVNEVPFAFQVFLTEIKVPKDPDVYALWHSSQPSNISHYKSVRIDKLLEEGRQTTNQEERIKIYADVQKYLLDDAPAAFLYFPYIYSVTRK